MKRISLLLAILILSIISCDYLMIPMDVQYDHLKAYGAVYNYLKERGGKVIWALNYKGGSFIFPETAFIADYCAARKITTLLMTESEFVSTKEFIEQENMEIVYLEKAPKIAVFTPLESNDPGISDEPWDDAVILVLEYAEIEFKKIYIDEVLGGGLEGIEWLHLHHEDFTGQFGKFYGAYKTAKWYIDHRNWLNRKAKEKGYDSVREMFRDVSARIASFVSEGGFLFAMCSATDSLDIALSAVHTDIVPQEFDGTPVAGDYKNRLDLSLPFVFTGFNIVENPDIYEFSNIDISDYSATPQSGKEDFFLFDFSAKQDPIPTMLCQNHAKLIHGFMGQTSTFDMRFIKDTVVIMGFLKDLKRAKYVYTGYGKGFCTYYGGHDPEDFAHKIGDPPVNVQFYRNSPGYRLILNNVLFPATQKKRMKT